MLGSSESKFGVLFGGARSQITNSWQTGHRAGKSDSSGSDQIWMNKSGTHGFPMLNVSAKSGAQSIIFIGSWPAKSGTHGFPMLNVSAKSGAQSIIFIGSWPATDCPAGPAVTRRGRVSRDHQRSAGSMTSHRTGRTPHSPTPKSESKLNMQLDATLEVK